MTTYKEAITASARTNIFCADFRFVPADAVEGATVSASPQFSLSRLDQINDVEDEMSSSIATLERNQWVLDGDHFLPISIDGRHYGFWSKAISGADTAFETPPFLEYRFDGGYGLIGVTLDFGYQFATKFQVLYFGENNETIAEQTIDNNRERRATVDMAHQDVYGVRVVFLKWQLPFQHAKLSGFLPGEIFIFDDENTISFELSETINPFDSAFVSPEFSLKFDNSDKKFDLLNPAGVFSYLQKRMEVSARIGTLVDGVAEYVNVGDFYLYDIPTDEQRETATLNCRPLIALFENVKYPTDHLDRTTVGDVVDIIFQTINAGIAYEVDESLRDIIANGYCGDDVPILDAFAMIAVAAGGYWRIERDGTCRLLPLPDFSATPMGAIDYDNAFEKPSISSSAITSVTVSGNRWSGFPGDDWTTTSDTQSLEPNDGNSVSITSAFIPSLLRCREIALQALAYYAHRFTWSSDWRGDPAMAVGDIVSLETDYGEIKSVVTSVDISLDNSNFLAERTGGRG